MLLESAPSNSTQCYVVLDDQLATDPSPEVGYFVYSGLCSALPGWGRSAGSWHAYGGKRLGGTLAPLAPPVTWSGTYSSLLVSNCRRAELGQGPALVAFGGIGDRRNGRGHGTPEERYRPNGWLPITTLLSDVSSGLVRR